MIKYLKTLFRRKPKIVEFNVGMLNAAIARVAAESPPAGRTRERIETILNHVRMAATVMSHSGMQQEIATSVMALDGAASVHGVRFSISGMGDKWTLHATRPDGIEYSATRDNLINLFGTTYNDVLRDILLTTPAILQKALEERT